MRVELKHKYHITVWDIGDSGLVDVCTEGCAQKWGEIVSRSLPPVVSDFDADHKTITMTAHVFTDNQLHSIQAMLEHINRIVELSDASDTAARDVAAHISVIKNLLK
jgi:hypothetical protein